MILAQALLIFEEQLGEWNAKLVLYFHTTCAATTHVSLAQLTATAFEREEVLGDKANPGESLKKM